MIKKNAWMDYSELPENIKNKLEEKYDQGVIALIVKEYIPEDQEVVLIVNDILEPAGYRFEDVVDVKLFNYLIKNSIN